MKLTKNAGRLQNFGVSSCVHIAADAGIRGTLVAGAYLATTGHWGLLSYTFEDCVWTTPLNIDAAELMALCEGFSRVVRNLRSQKCARPLTLYTDNQQAAVCLQSWVDGSTSVPLWSRTHPQYLHEARLELQAWNKEITVVKVPRKQNRLQDACHRMVGIARELAHGSLRQSSTGKRVRAVASKAISGF